MCGPLRRALLELWEDNALPPPWILAIPADQPLPALLSCYRSYCSDTHTHTRAHTLMTSKISLVLQAEMPWVKQWTRDRNLVGGAAVNDKKLIPRHTLKLFQHCTSSSSLSLCVCVTCSKLSLDPCTYLPLQRQHFYSPWAAAATQRKQTQPLTPLYYFRILDKCSQSGDCGETGSSAKQDHKPVTQL